MKIQRGFVKQNNRFERQKLHFLSDQFKEYPHQHTYQWIATYRLNQPRGRFTEYSLFSLMRKNNIYPKYRQLTATLTTQWPCRVA